MCNQPPICQNHPTARYIEYHTRCPPGACYFEFLMHSVRQSTVISLVMYIPVKIQKKKNILGDPGFRLSLASTICPWVSEDAKNKIKNNNEITGLQETLQLLEGCFQVNESMRLSVAPNDEIPLNVLKIHFRLSKFILLIATSTF